MKLGSLRLSLIILLVLALAITWSSILLHDLARVRHDVLGVTATLLHHRQQGAPRDAARRRDEASHNRSLAPPPLPPLHLAPRVAALAFAAHARRLDGHDDGHGPETSSSDGSDELVDVCEQLLAAAAAEDEEDERAASSPPPLRNVLVVDVGSGEFGRRAGGALRLAAERRALASQATSAAVAIATLPGAKTAAHEPHAPRAAPSPRNGRFAWQGVAWTSSRDPSAAAATATGVAAAPRPSTPASTDCGPSSASATPSEAAAAAAVEAAFARTRAEFLETPWHGTWLRGGPRDAAPAGHSSVDTAAARMGGEGEAESNSADGTPAQLSDGDVASASVLEASSAAAAASGRDGLDAAAGGGGDASGAFDRGGAAALLASLREPWLLHSADLAFSLREWMAAAQSLAAAAKEEGEEAEVRHRSDASPTRRGGAGCAHAPPALATRDAPWWRRWWWWWWWWGESRGGDSRTEAHGRIGGDSAAARAGQPTAGPAAPPRRRSAKAPLLLVVYEVSCDDDGACDAGCDPDTSRASACAAQRERRHIANAVSHPTNPRARLLVVGDGADDDCDTDGR